MSLLISESGSEPITTAEAKAWAKVENSDEDSLISSLITSCRREIESYTKTFYDLKFGKLFTNSNIQKQSSIHHVCKQVA